MRKMYMDAAVASINQSQKKSSSYLSYSRNRTKSKQEGGRNTALLLVNFRYTIENFQKRKEKK